MKTQLFFCFLLWGGLSCSYTVQHSTNASGVENNENEIRLPDLVDNNLLALTGDFLFEGTPRYIPLETTAESRLDTIDKLVTHQTGYYLLDRSQRTLFHFDQQGKYRSKWRGETAELCPQDFQIEGDRLYLLPAGMEKLLVLSLPDWRIEERISLPERFASFALSDDYIYFSSGNTSPSLKNIHVMNRKSHRIAARYADFPSSQQQKEPLAGFGLHSHQGEVYAVFPSAFHLARLEVEKEDTLLQVRLEENDLFPKELRFTSREKQAAYCEEHLTWPARELHDFFCTDAYYIFSFFFGKMPYTVFYSRADKAVQHFGSFWSSEAYPFLTHRIWACNDDKFYQALPAARAAKSKKAAGIKELGNVKEGDNPVLVEYRLRTQ